MNFPANINTALSFRPPKAPWVTLYYRYIKMREEERVQTVGEGAKGCIP